MTVKVGDIVELEQWNVETNTMVQKKFKVVSIDEIPGGGTIIQYQEVEE